jgi:hypothetical protein
MTIKSICQILRVTKSSVSELRAHFVLLSPTDRTVCYSVNGLNEVSDQNTDVSQFFQYLALSSNKHSDILNFPATLTVSPVQACS